MACQKGNPGYSERARRLPKGAARQVFLLMDETCVADSEEMDAPTTSPTSSASTISAATLVLVVLAVSTAV
jgi:hypothetical protein